MAISTAFKLLLQKVATRLQLSSCPTFFVVFFIFIIYCGSVDFQCCLCFRYLGTTSDIHRHASILALGSFSHIGYYSELNRIPCATQYTFSDYLLDTC